MPKIDLVTGRTASNAIISSNQNNSTIKQLVLKHVDKSDLTIGIVAEPTFESVANFSILVYQLASKLDAIIFNGSHFLDMNGDALIEC